MKNLLPAIIVVVGAAVLIFGICCLMFVFPEKTDDVGSIRIVETLGFSEPRILERYPGRGAAWQRGCSQDDTSAVDMRALDAAGRAHTFVVCCGGYYGNNGGCSIRVR